MLYSSSRVPLSVYIAGTFGSSGYHSHSVSNLPQPSCQSLESPDYDKKMSSRSATGYHLETTGQAAKTAAEHAVDKVTDPSIEFMGACFCPFVQRAWIALEVLNQGLPDDQSRRASKVDYAYVEIDPYKKPKELLEVSPKGLVPVSCISSI